MVLLAVVGEEFLVLVVGFVEMGTKIGWGVLCGIGWLMTIGKAGV